MKLHDYIEKAKAELENLEAKFLIEHLKDPKNLPIEMDEEDWIEQEISWRWG